MRRVFINVRRPVSMEKTDLRGRGLFGVDTLNTVARSFLTPHSRLGEHRMEGQKFGRWRCLFSFPPDSVAGALPNDSDRREGVAHVGRGREVYPLQGTRPDRNSMVKEAVYKVHAL